MAAARSSLKVIWKKSTGCVAGSPLGVCVIPVTTGGNRSITSDVQHILGKWSGTATVDPRHIELQHGPQCGGATVVAPATRTVFHICIVVAGRVRLARDPVGVGHLLATGPEPRPFACLVRQAQPETAELVERVVDPIAVRRVVDRDQVAAQRDGQRLGLRPGHGIGHQVAMITVGPVLAELGVIDAILTFANRAQKLCAHGSPSSSVILLPSAFDNRPAVPGCYRPATAELSATWLPAVSVPSWYRS